MRPPISNVAAENRDELFIGHFIFANLSVMSSLCVHCSRIPRSFFSIPNDIARDEDWQSLDTSKPWVYEHALSGSSLAVSASAGCPLCILIWKSHRMMNGWRDVELASDGRVYLRCGGRFDRERIRVICDGLEGEFASLNSAIVPDTWMENDASISEVEVVHAWMKTCRQSHPECWVPVESYVPTRLIDLDPADGTMMPRIVFSNNLRNKEIDYAALSYCWGTDMPEHVKTTSKNVLNRANDGFSIETLPRVLKEALIFTRTLGLRYLWIDAICILQDLKSDWKIQSAKMGLVYSHANITIAASASAHTGAGLPTYTLKNRLGNESLILHCQDRNNGRQERICISLGDPETSRSLQLAQDPLQKRGWALQERHLSRRVIFFSRNYLVWECKKGRSSTILPWSPWSPITRDNRRLFDCDERSLREQIIRGAWQKLVHEYSQRNLTFEKDKFYAIAGLVKAIDSAFDDQYLAGIWRSTLPTALCWIRDYRELHVNQTAARLRAPSWSWGSLNGTIGIGAESLSADTKHAVTLYAKVISAKTTTTDDEYLGLTYKGWIKLKGRLKKATLEASAWNADFFNANPHINYNAELFETMEGRNCLGTCILDETPQHDIAMQVFCLAIMRDNSRPYPSIHSLPMVDVSTKRDELPKMLAALVLVPTATFGEFRRVGLSVHMLESVFGGCEEIDVTIV